MVVLCVSAVHYTNLLTPVSTELTQSIVFTTFACDVITAVSADDGVCCAGTAGAGIGGSGEGDC